MKRVLISILAILCLAPLTLSAQAYKPASVSISQEKVTRGGKVYFAHTVLDHQTLFSISRTYGVTYQEIVDANPDCDLTHGQIRVGQVLLIPQKELPKEVQTPSQAPQTAASQPAPTPAATAPASAPDPEDYTLYTAKWYEDLNMIAAKFNIPKQVLMAYNGMSSDQIARRQRIRIPLHPDKVTIPAPSPAPSAPEVAEAPVTVPEEPAPEPEPELAGTAPDTLSDPGEHSGFSLRDLFRKKHASDPVSVAVILPFGAKAQINHSAFDLYSGMLLAVRDLAASGIKADLTVIDSRNAATPVTASKLEGCDLVSSKKKGKWNHYSLNCNQWAAFRDYIESIRVACRGEGGCCS